MGSDNLKLLKALAKNRIVIVRQVSGKETLPTEDDSSLINRCLDRSFQETERLICGTDAPSVKREESKNFWDSLAKRLFRS